MHIFCEKTEYRLRSVIKISKLILYFSRLALSFLQEIEDRRRLGNKNEQVHFVLLSTCTIFCLKTEDRRRFGIKNEQVLFVLLSTCTIFASNFI